MLKNMNTNLFGPVNLARAILPTFRKKRAGTIVWVSSKGGWQGALGAGPYCATKFAMEGESRISPLNCGADGCCGKGIVECLQTEIASFGVRNILFEPGLFRTKVWSQGNIVWGNLGIPDYAELDGALRTGVAGIDGNQPGDPAKAAERMVDVVRGEGMAAGREIPLRMPLGRDSLEDMRNKCLSTLKIIEEWEDLILSTDLDSR